VGFHDFPHVSERLGPRNSVGGSFLSRSIALPKADMLALLGTAAMVLQPSHWF
jgi:hypothetical protein